MKKIAKHIGKRVSSGFAYVISFFPKKCQFDIEPEENILDFATEDEDEKTDDTTKKKENINRRRMDKVYYRFENKICKLANKEHGNGYKPYTVFYNLILSKREFILSGFCSPSKLNYWLHHFLDQWMEQHIGSNLLDGNSDRVAAEIV